MLGGAFAVYHYTNWWRNTHDIDCYVLPDDVDAAAEALEEAGWHDLGEQAHGDREWIYHAGKGTMIVDLIFRFANLENYVAPDWFERAPRARFLDMDVKFIPLEEIVWIKTFVINRHRCDWPDVMRIIRAQCRNINWDRLLEMIGEHWLLLAGLVDIFDWQHPESMGCIPNKIRRIFAERRKEYRAHPFVTERQHLLDPWIYHRVESINDSAGSFVIDDGSDVNLKCIWRGSFPLLQVGSFVSVTGAAGAEKVADDQYTPVLYSVELQAIR